MNFGARLKKVRMELGISRIELAKEIGTSEAVIGRYERNERTPSIVIANNIARAMNVSLDYLVGNIKQDRKRRRSKNKV